MEGRAAVRALLAAMTGRQRSEDSVPRRRTTETSLKPPADLRKSEVQRLLPVAGDVSTGGVDPFAVIPPTIRFRFERLVTKVVPTLDSGIGGRGALATLAAVAVGHRHISAYYLSNSDWAADGTYAVLLKCAQLSLSAPVCWTPIV